MRRARGKGDGRVQVSSTPPPTAFNHFEQGVGTWGKMQAPPPCCWSPPGGFRVLRDLRSQLGCCGFPGGRSRCPGQGQVPASGPRGIQRSPGGGVRKNTQMPQAFRQCLKIIPNSPQACDDLPYSLSCHSPPHSRPAWKQGSTLRTPGPR